LHNLSNPLTSMEFQSFTRTQIAEWYEICTKTLKKWFKEAGFNFGKRLLKPCEVKMIIEHLGTPPNLPPFFNNSLPKGSAYHACTREQLATWYQISTTRAIPVHK
jgi:hypothetical protein